MLLLKQGQLEHIAHDSVQSEFYKPEKFYLL